MHRVAAAVQPDSKLGAVRPEGPHQGLGGRAGRPRDEPVQDGQGAQGALARTGVWFSDDCAPTGGADNETTTHGWTAKTLRAFLQNQHGQGVRSVDVWCGVGGQLPMPCPTCPWVFEELERWKQLQ